MVCSSVLFVSWSSKKTRPGSSEIRRCSLPNAVRTAHCVRKSVYSCQFMTSSQQPTRSNCSTSTNSASGAQSSEENPGSFALATVSLTMRSNSSTLADSAPSASAGAFLVIVALPPRSRASRGPNVADHLLATPAARVAGPMDSVGAMEYRTLGRTGIKVSPLCLGAMMFGAWGTQDHDESIRIIHAALDAGINFVDTADVYSFGESEEIVGKALARTKRHKVVLATKVHGQMGQDPNAQGNSRRWIIAECDNSLRRLGTDYIDLYQIHRPSPETDIDETLGALTDLVRAGKIRYFGSSTFPAHEIVEAQWVAERRARERFVTEQPPYSILVRGIEKDVLPMCQKYGMGVSRGARWRAAGCRAPSGRARRTRAVARPCCPTTTTCRCRATAEARAR